MISIIIPIYNGQKYILNCLNHLFTNLSSNIEVIAVNDGSNDNSSLILREYALFHPTLRIIEKGNEGAARARRDGILQAKGDHIAFLDIDDEADGSLYTILDKTSKENTADIIIFDYTEVANGTDRIVKNIFQKNESFPITNDRAMRYLHTRKAYFPFPWNKLYKKELFCGISFPENNFVGEDYDMQLKLLRRAKSIDYLDIATYRYNISESSVSRSGYSDATVLAYKNYKKRREHTIALNPELKKEVDNYLTDEFMAFIIAMGRNNTYNKTMISEIKTFIRKNLFNYIFSSYPSVIMKASAITLSFSHRALIFAYKMLK